jgi:DNA-binding NarL/FixJ family response regulator
MKPANIRVVVADDDPLTCQFIKLRLQEAGIECVGVAPDGWKAVDLVTELEPEVILLDITMPGMDGLEALSSIKAVRPQTIVIMLTAHRNIDYLAQALACGAAAYLTKGELESGGIARTILGVFNGDVAIVEHDLLQAAFDHARRISASMKLPDRASVDELTGQEKEVLRLISLGKSNREIATDLVVSYNTVKTHTQNIFRKLDVSDRTQAAILAIRSGLTK